MKKKKILKEKRVLDGRYKSNVDTGAMTKQTVSLPLKPIEKEEPKLFVPHYKKMRPDKYNSDGTLKQKKRKK